MPITEYQTDVLFLLIGANPLPNYVSTLLLARQHATVYLLHTGGETSTLEVATRLKIQLQDRRPDLTLIPEEIDRTDGRQITACLERLTARLSGSTRVGLNYTGGTKPMAVYAYHTLQKAFPQGIFSYLDAASLSMVIQCREGTPVQKPFVGAEVNVTLKTLFAMHGYEILKQRAETIIPPELQKSLLRVNLRPEGHGQWRNWVEWLRKSKELGEKPALPDTNVYPKLLPIIQTLDDLCGGSASPEAVAHLLGFKKLRSCIKAFQGDWLEDYVWRALKEANESLGLEARAMGMEFKGPYDASPMEIDILAIQGYQLFALSCAASMDKGYTKTHFMEMMVRARQLGGEEARFGLVCLYNDAERLERELYAVAESHDKIAVFGPRHLPDLAGHLERWIRTASLM